MTIKVFIGAAIAALLLASPAAAQAQSATPSCGGFEPAPAFPDGATASRSAIERANSAYEVWSQARVVRLRACKAEIDALNVQLAAIYDPAKAELDAVVAAWSAEVAEYNARGSSSSNRRDHGGVITRPDD